MSHLVMIPGNNTFRPSATFDRQHTLNTLAPVDRAAATRYLERYAPDLVEMVLGSR
jgi:hypothetical protein